MITVAQALTEAIDRLQKASGNSREAQRKARLLMRHVLEVETVGIVTRENEELTAEDEAVFKGLVVRAMNEPVHRLIGWREFHGLKLAVSPATLEPRDDTETLVDLALTQIEDKKRPWRFADLGTGTGAVALALLSELPNATALATDIDAEALDTAQRNAEANGLSARFETVCGNWLDVLAEPFDFIVSNPPYVPSATIETLHPNVRDHDPRKALDGGVDGLDAYRSITASAALFLEPGGFLALEIGHNKAGAVSALALAESFAATTVKRDLAGNNRALLISR
ncbi:MAG: peptide chain release factor N(5)-glutamine methyltransferase [Rhizobiaceae bacterium]